MRAAWELMSRWVLREDGWGRDSQDLLVGADVLDALEGPISEVGDQAAGGADSDGGCVCTYRRNRRHLHSAGGRSGSGCKSKVISRPTVWRVVGVGQVGFCTDQTYLRSSTSDRCSSKT